MARQSSNRYKGVLEPPPKKPGGGLRTIIVVVAAVLAWHFLFGAKPKTSQGTPSGAATDTSPTVAPPARSTATGPYARSARRNDWPPLADSSANTPLAGWQSANYYVVLDGSGSMNMHQCAGSTSKIAAATDALNRFIDLVPADANIGLTTFDVRGTEERVPLARKNAALLRAELGKVKAEGGTPLRSAITLGYEALQKQARQQLGYGEYHLVIVTDGKPEPASEDPSAIVQAILYGSPVILHTIGFCIGTDHVLNQPGRSYYAAADDPDQLRQGLQSVLAEVPSFDATSFSAQ